MKRLLAFALLITGLAHAQTTVTVTASHFGGQTPITGTVFWQPTLQNGQPTSFGLGNGGGQATNKPLSAQAQGGVFSITVPNTDITNPQHICFRVTAVSYGSQVLGPGYNCIQPHANAVNSGDWCQNGVCNFDLYVPNMTAVPVQYAPAITAQVPLTDAPTITLNASSMYTPAALQLNPAIPSRTLNVTGLIRGNTFSLLVGLLYPAPSPSISDTLSVWSPNTSVTAGQVFWDENGHLQEVTGSGYTGAQEPTWNTSLGTTTEVGGVGPPHAVWTDLGPPLSLVFGSGCTWVAASGSGLDPLGTSVVFPPGTGGQIVLQVVYDGANCNLTEVP